MVLALSPHGGLFQHVIWKDPWCFLNLFPFMFWHHHRHMVYNSTYLFNILFGFCKIPHHFELDKKTPPSFNSKSPQMCVYITHWSNGCSPFAMCLWQWMYRNMWCNVSPNMQDILHSSFMRSTFTWDESNNMCFF
jgi:hypothetical protein